MALIYSWLSPSHRPVATLFDKFAYIFNGWDRGRVWNGIAATDAQQGIDGPPLTWVGTSVAAPGVSDIGTHRARYRYFDQDRNNYSPPSNAVDVIIVGAADAERTYGTAGGLEINLSGDARVTHIILEVTGIDGIEFFEADRVANDGTSPVFNLTDLELQEFDVNFPVEVGSAPPPLFRYAVRFRSRIWGGGQVRHNDGVAIAVNGNATVTGVGTNWSTYGLEGRYLKIGATQQRILSVQSTTSLTLEEVWGAAGSPAAGEAYEIFTEDDLLFFSEANFPEVYQGSNSIAVNQSITGLATYGTDLLIYSQSSIDRLTYTNSPVDGVRREVPGNRGALTHNAIVQVEGVVYALDKRGVHAYQGGSPVHLSRPVDAELLEAADMSAPGADQIFAVWYPKPRVIRWYYRGVSDPVADPRRYVQYDLARKSWSFGELDLPFTGGEGYEDRVTAVPYLGDENGYTWADDLGLNAGGGTYTPARVTVLEGSVPTNTFVPLDPGQLGVFDQLDGVLVRNERNFTATVDFNDASSLTLIAPGFATPPSAGDELLIGRLVSRLKTRAHYMDDNWSTKKRGVYLWLHFQPQTEGQFLVRFYRDLSDVAYKGYDASAISAATGRLEQEGVTVPAFNTSDFSVLATIKDGVAKVPVGAEPWRVIQAEIEVVEPRTQLALYGYKFTSGEGRQTNA